MMMDQNASEAVTMSGEQKRSNELHDLSSDLRRYFSGEYEEIQGELTQVQSLLHDAIGKLSQYFLSLESDSWQQLTVMDEIMAEITVRDDQMSARMETLTRVNQDVRARVGQAVTVLQFEDLASQLISKVLIRVEQMGQVLSSFSEQDSAERISDLKAVRMPCVTQESMEAGSIDLFDS